MKVFQIELSLKSTMKEGYGYNDTGCAERAMG